MARKSQWEKAKDLYKAEMIQRRDEMLAEYGKTLSEWEAMDRLEKYYWIAGMHSTEYFEKMKWNVYDIAFQMSNAGDITLFPEQTQALGDETLPKDFLHPPCLSAGRLVNTIMTK